MEAPFYGLFSAGSVWHEEDRTRADGFACPQTSAHLSAPVIDRRHNAAASKRILETTGPHHVVRNAADVPNRVERIAFFQAFEGGMVVRYFYEPFLAAFDPELRKQLGVW